MTQFVAVEAVQAVLGADPQKARRILHDGRDPALGQSLFAAESRKHHIGRVRCQCASRSSYGKSGVGENNRSGPPGAGVDTARTQGLGLRRTGLEGIELLDLLGRAHWLTPA